MNARNSDPAQVLQVWYTSDTAKYQLIIDSRPLIQNWRKCSAVSQVGHTHKRWGDQSGLSILKHFTHGSEFTYPLTKLSILFLSVNSLVYTLELNCEHTVNVTWMNIHMHQLRHCIRNKDEYLKPMSKSPNTNAILLMSILHSPGKVAIEGEHISSASKAG